MDYNTDGLEETPRRSAEEYSRYKLADVKEENEDETTLTSASPKRRNRYSSHNSTILTEDTDSFIIGQRVWVGGTKPGHIAYIGETQFAPGEWAGIALDLPIGKNDGSVAGIRYFQCEPKKGIFSRLTRLTRYPLDIEIGGAGDYITSTPANGARNSLSPTGSSSPFKSPPSLTTSNTSISSALIDFKIGDRVIIKSSQGSKIGNLRFMGCTEFAGGEWCGVELDEPRGKNDGSVGGKRYFDCRPNFGLFAPVSKVSKSPSNRKPTGCIIHSGTGIPPSGFRRANSKESITSNVSITSAASGVRRVRLGVTSLTAPQKTSPKPAAPIPTRTALQEVLKEKQQHIEQLLKERDLERAELARAASQADEIEQKYTTLRQEHDLYRDETEKKLLEHLKILDELKRDRKELVANLEDEKRKVEDLQFRYEEAEISKSDLEITDETNQTRIREVEIELESSKQRIEALELDSNRLFETEENLLRSREESEALKYEIEVAAKKILSLEADGTASKCLEQSLQKEILDLKTIIKERDDVIERFKNDITQVSEQFESTRSNFVKELDQNNKKLEENKIEIANKEFQINHLKEELIKTEIVLTEKSKSFEFNVANSKEFEDKIIKEVNKLKTEVSSKTFDLEQSREVISSKDEEIKKLTTQMENLKVTIQSQNIDFNRYKQGIQDIENGLREELEKSRNLVTTKILEIEEIKKDCALILAQKESDLKDANRIIQGYKEEIEKNTSTLSQIEEESINSKEHIKSIFELKLKESEHEIQKIRNDLQNKNSELDIFCSNLAQLKNEIILKEDEIKKLQNELDSSTKRLQEENQKFTKSKEEITNLQLNLADLERKFKVSEDKNTELTQNKNKLELEIQNLIGFSGDFGAKHEELTKELRAKENFIENIKSEFISKLQDVERSKQEIELQYNNLMEKSEADLRESEEMLQKVISEREALKQNIEKLSFENKNIVEALHIKLAEYQNELQERDQLLKKMQDEKTQIEDKFKQELENKSKEFSNSITELHKQLSDVTKESDEVKSELSKKTMEIIEFELKFNKEMELSKQTEAIAKTAYEEKIKVLELQLNEKQREYQKMMESTNNELSEKLLDIEVKNKGFNKDKQKLIEETQKLRAELEEQLKITREENENVKKDFEAQLEERAKSIENVNNKCKALNDELKQKDEIIVNMQNDLKAVGNNLIEKMEKAAELEAKIKALENKMQDVANEKDKNIHELNLKLKKSLENEIDFQKSIRDLQGKETSLKSEFDQQLTKLCEELNVKSNELKKANEELLIIKKEIASSHRSSGEKDNQIALLKSELHINHQFIEKLKNEEKDLMQQKENANKALSETEMITSKLNEEISKLNEELKVSVKMVFDLNHASNLYMTILQMLNLSKKQKIELVDNLDNIVRDSCDEESYTKLCKLIDGIRIHDEPCEEAKQLKEMQDELLKIKRICVEAQDKATKKDSEIGAMKEEYQALLQSTNLSKPKVDNPSMSCTINNNPATNEQLLEEKILAESQVAFLNSIIVDMQKKNEEQKVRIEILEMGYSPAAAQELGLIGLADRRMPAPRMYCDICEEFDLHETEDCPQQANDDPPPRRGPKQQKPSPRPYCDICEEFGHTTENCQDDRTF